MREEVQPLTNVSIFVEFLYMNWKNCKRFNLDMALLFRSVDLVKKIIDNDKDLLNTQDYKGSTPLHYAVERQFTEAVIIFSQMGPNFWLKNERGETCLDLARKKSLSDITGILHSHMENKVSEESTYSERDLHRKKIGNLDKLLEDEKYGARYPLHFAVIKGDIVAVKKFISEERYLDLCDDNHIFALEYAIFKERFEISELLIKSGAMTELVNIEMNGKAGFYYQQALEEGSYRTACMLRPFKEKKKNTSVVEEAQQIIHKPSLVMQNSELVKFKELKGDRGCEAK